MWVGFFEVHEFHGCEIIVLEKIFDQVRVLNYAYRQCSDKFEVQSCAMEIISEF